MLAYEKQRIVRKISLMVRMGSNPYGSRPNFFGQQKFAFDEVGKVDSAFCRIALLGFAIRINTSEAKRNVRVLA